MCSSCSQLYDFFGKIFGWILLFFYNIFNNYGLAIIFFAITARILLYPLTIKQQKSQAAQARLQPKIQQLQAQYGNNKEGYNQAVQELYEKEGVNPGAGCLPLLIQFPLLFGLYEAIRNPLTCMLHLSDKLVNNLSTAFGFEAKDAYRETKIIEKLRGIDIGNIIASSGNASGSASGNVIEKLSTLNLSSADIGDIGKIIDFSKGFRFLGFDLLQTPSLSPINLGVIVSLIVFITSVGSMHLTNRITNTNKNSNAAAGCSTSMMSYGMAAMSTWFSFMVPVALAVYWITGSCIAPVQSWITNKFFGAQTMNAKAEAQRVAMLKIDEQKVIDSINDKKGKLILKPDYSEDKFEGVGIQGGSSGNKKKKK